MPYLKDTIKLSEPGQIYQATNKNHSLTEIDLKPQFIETKVKVRLTAWSEMLQTDIVLYGLLQLATILLVLGFSYQLYKIFYSFRKGCVFQGNALGG
ncbi:hypothetical protein ACFSKU_06890 [Pontibacter silvestris]|uniref:Uncharacterized protein n=1 Tax=Pontibacter silvestris TaxID=2305183 RepID=A0ABW4WX69_9BACT|nr:hypothetical protein [Pontibacter silvestris]MCC9136515.1 hypothetical protein [Pontibacter silvestris]